MEAPNKTGKGGFGDNPQNINKAGRPKLGQAITPFLRSEGDVEEEVSIHGELKKLPRKQILAMRIWKEALAGDYNFIKLIVNYVDGMPIQQIEVGNMQEENPILDGLRKIIEGEKKIETSTTVDNNVNNIQPKAD